MKAIFILCGFYQIAFAVFHLYFPKIFNWKKDLQNLSAANKAITQILNNRLIYFFLFTGIMYFVFDEQILRSKLGIFIHIGMLVFWIGRTIEQFIYLKLNNRFVHTLSTIFILGIILFSIPIIHLLFPNT